MGVQADEPDWFDELWRAKSRELHRFAAARVGPDDADDVVQNVFDALLQRRDDPPPHPEYWIFTTARFMISSDNRREHRRAEIRTTHPVDLAPRRADDPSDLAAERDAVCRAYDQLSPADQHILAVASQAGEITDAVAAELGIGRHAATVRLFRARRRFHKALEASE